MQITCIDFETANQKRASACSIGIACIQDGKVTESHEWLLKPKKGYGFFREDFTEIHGLTWFDVKDSKEFDAVYPEIKPYLDDAILVAHNTGFDMDVLQKLLNLYELPSPACSYFCTLSAVRRLWPELGKHSLDAVCEHIGHEFDHHKAGSDAEAAGHVLLAMMKQTQTSSIHDLAKSLNLNISPL